LREKYACPCCGYLTLDRKPPGTFDVCPVCYWEDDKIQYNNPKYKGGANKVSLTEAKNNFILFGAISKEFINFVKKLGKEEI
jgi:hypothetical protein